VDCGTFDGYRVVVSQLKQGEPMRLVIACAAISLVCACSPPSPQPQPDEMETINATRVDQATPDGALDNSAVNHGDESANSAQRTDSDESSPNAY
jgi:hypothetical protein